MANALPALRRAGRYPTVGDEELLGGVLAGVDIAVDPETAETVSSTIIRNIFCRAIFCTNKLQTIVDCSLLHLYIYSYID